MKQKKLIMKLQYIITFGFSIFLHYLSTAQNWQQLNDFPGAPRDDGTGFIIGDSAFFGSGLTPWWSNQTDFYGLNLVSEQWFEITPLPANEGRQYATGFSFQNKGYVFGGYNGSNFLNDIWCYDPVTNVWSQKNALPADGRSGCSSFILNDEVYVFGGKTSTNFAINEVWCYDPVTDTWTQKNNLPFDNCWRGSATPLQNKGYLLFGRNNENAYLNTLYEYEPIGDAWTQIASFPSSGRSHASMLALDNSLYTFFGVDSLDHSFNDLWKFDPANYNWQILPGLPALGRRGGISLVHDHVIYYSTGINENNERLQETWKYSPSLVLSALNATQEKKLVGIFDVTGKETLPKQNVVLIYKYDDGTFERRFTTQNE